MSLQVLSVKHIGPSARHSALICISLAHHSFPSVSNNMPQISHVLSNDNRYIRVQLWPTCNRWFWADQPDGRLTHSPFFLPQYVIIELHHTGWWPSWSGVCHLCMVQKILTLPFHINHNIKVQPSLWELDIYFHLHIRFQHILGKYSSSYLQLK